MISADEKAWRVESEGRAYGLHVILLKREYVLPWSQFLYAEGTSEEVQAFFSTHDVLIRGTELGSLLSDFASQLVTVLREPARVDNFGSQAGPRITGLQVRAVEAEALEKCLGLPFMGKFFLGLEAVPPDFSPEF